MSMEGFIVGPSLKVDNPLGRAGTEDMLSIVGGGGGGVEGVDGGGRGWRRGRRGRRGWRGGT